VHVGVWISKSPDHNIIVMDTKGLSRKELEQEEVEWNDTYRIVNLSIQV
jgi:hypothetical protein